MPGTLVILDTTSTISAVENDSFTFNWEYLADAGSPAITIYARTPDGPLKFHAPSLPAGQEFLLLRFKVTATSNSSGKQSEENVAIVVRNAATPPVGTVTSAGQVWMDRNLGASQVATSSTDSAAYGDLYQWGRGADGHQLRTSPTTATTSATDAPGHGSFITTNTSPYDWRVPQNNSLWQGVSGTNNPCPSGFRLPMDTELDTERASWASNNSAGAFLSPLKLVVAGYRYRSDGTLVNAGSGGNYWSSTVDGSRARYLLFGSGSAYMNSDYRAYGFSLRCLKD